MEADWSVEIGGDAAVIETGWPGWIDIAQDRKRIALLDEVLNFPALGQAMENILSAKSRFLPTKCDFWRSDEPVDPYEFDAQPGTHHTSANCSLDLLPQPVTRWSNLLAAESWARAAVAAFQSIRCPGARVEIVLRQAFEQQQSGIGIALYASACGPTTAQAAEALIPALHHAVVVVCTADPDAEDTAETSGGLQ